MKDRRNMMCGVRAVNIATCPKPVERVAGTPSSEHHERSRTRPTTRLSTMPCFPVRPVLLLALVAGTLQAQKTNKEVKPGAVELPRLENAWATGLVKRDRALFEKLLAPKFVYT